MVKQLELTSKVMESQFGHRLDRALTKLFPSYSRSIIKKLILDERIKINGKIIVKPQKKVVGGEEIIINTVIQNNSPKIQNIPLNIVYEDSDILVINKQSNFVVHPGAGNPDGTMLNALLYYYPAIINVPRAGIVHRLDKNTTGLMVVAKTIIAHINLVKALKNFEITREYEAIAIGRIIVDGIISHPISRHSIKRTQMTVNPIGRSAITYYRILEQFGMHTRLRLRLKTGRTHQIRVHLAHIGYPLVGDCIYFCNPRIPRGVSKNIMPYLVNFKRQALHSIILRLNHPITGIKMEWFAPLPHDMLELTRALRADTVSSQDKIMEK
ncbi:23S rRNA pseudouridine(1911/1915/1917) synthase RluD [Candidatus Profftia tarda]|uniref:Pseudouridine synthase n=1 Tax=Candidatus Profftia tarda TaxID=1177216 RepID=A0A8E4F0X8_9ENTR|nr:23S rRNA pseudouridine(1911/1915/1917) synthase RluD [Candidatus Profftia tarda]CAD6507055.1 Ribosomal large subunit pseudouridine synthase D [Candidatus Profftia tarda]